MTCSTLGRLLICTSGSAGPGIWNALKEGVDVSGAYTDSKDLADMFI